MGLFIFQIIFINLGLIVLFSVYQLIKTQLSFFVRRLVILALPILAVFSGYLNYYLTFKTGVQVKLKLIELNVVSINDDSLNYSSVNSMDVEQIFIYVFVLGIIISLILSLIKVFKIIQFVKNNHPIKHKAYYLLSTPKKHSFSFFNFIHLSADLDENEKKIVLEHELIHVKKKHSFDLIIIEVFHALFWFNPVFLFIKKELIIVHEFEVDELMYDKYGDNYIIKLLNHTLGVNSSQLVLTNQFYSKISLVKRTKIMKKKVKLVKPLLVSIPVTVLLLATVSFTHHKKSLNSLKPITNEIVKDSVYTEVDVYPEFPGGEKEMMKFIIENFKLSEKAKKDGVEGTVYTGFVVSKKGKIKDVKVLKGLTPEIDAECARVISLMPKWKSGKVNNKRVNVEYVIPINVVLQK